LKTLDAGSWKDPKFASERLPTLAESLDYAKGKIGVYIEIKNSDNDDTLKAEILELAANHQTVNRKLTKEMMALIEASGSRNLDLTRKVIAEVRKRRMKKEIVIQSFSPVVCAVALAEAPELRTEFLSGVDKDDPDGWEGNLRWAFLLEVDGFNSTAKALDPGRLAMFHAAGMTVAAWTVDNTPEMRRLALWGIDAIITNRPDACLRTLEKAGRR
jgi:glycerophosphoryl diester phosphodiesterase